LFLFAGSPAGEPAKRNKEESNSFGTAEAVSFQMFFNSTDSENALLLYGDTP
jgi:hypothetical protein